MTMWVNSLNFALVFSAVDALNEMDIIIWTVLQELNFGSLNSFLSVQGMNIWSYHVVDMMTEIGLITQLYVEKSDYCSSTLQH